MSPNPFRQPDNRPQTEVVAAVLFRADGAFLLSSRPPGKAYAGYWEFAGGKVEAGETPFAALQRELAEELGVTVHQATPWLTQVYHYEHAHVRITFFRVAADDWSGALQSKEGQAWCWTQPNNIQAAPLLPANTPILAALGVPTAWQADDRGGLTADGGAYTVLPEAFAAADSVHILFDRVDRIPAAEPFRHWLAISGAGGLTQAAEKQAVALWRVSNEREADAVLRAMAAGLQVPLVVCAAAETVAQFGSRWQVAGVHAVVCAEP